MAMTVQQQKTEAKLSLIHLLRINVSIYWNKPFDQTKDEKQTSIINNKCIQTLNRISKHSNYECGTCVTEFVWCSNISPLIIWKFLNKYLRWLEAHPIFSWRWNVFVFSTLMPFSGFIEKNTLGNRRKTDKCINKMGLWQNFF